MSDAAPNKIWRSKWEELLGETDSPIEALLLKALCKRAVDRGYEVAREPKGNSTIAIRPQRVVDRYCLDFDVLFHFHGEHIQIDVECDGFEHHGRTKGQQTHDRRRDRALAELGYQVMRFTGSEINANAGLCAAEIMNRIEGFQHHRILRSMEEMP